MLPTSKSLEEIERELDEAEEIEREREWRTKVNLDKLTDDQRQKALEFRESDEGKSLQKRHDELNCEEEALVREIAEVESLPAPSLNDRDLKKRQLEALKASLNAVQEEIADVDERLYLRAPAATQIPPVMATSKSPT